LFGLNKRDMPIQVNRSALAGACENCARSDRRGFLRDAVAAAVAALGTLGVRQATAGAVPVHWISGLARRTAGPTYPLPTADGVQIDRDNQVILVRWQGAVYAFNLSCPHQNTALRWDDADGRFQCPKHHSKYQPDGTFISGRATRNMDRLSLRRDGETIVVDVDAMHKSNDDGAGWAAAVVRL
jgi:nitrite reductase/ring-hydroxylating ferredoxin subunit